MDRLTVDTDLSFCDIAQCSSTPGGSFCEDGYCDQRRCYERLREYERIGLEPEEVPTGLEMAKIHSAMVRLKEYHSAGTAEEFRALKEAEQKRRAGCQRCWNGECMMSGVDYSCETTCDKCRYSLRDKHFCPDCGRDLKGERHD